MNDFKKVSVEYRNKRTDDALTVLVSVLLSIDVFVPSNYNGVLVKKTSDHLKWNCIYTNEELIPEVIKRNYQIVKTSFTDYYKYRMNGPKYTHGVAIDCENGETKIFLEDSFFINLFEIIFNDLSA